MNGEEGVEQGFVVGRAPEIRDQSSESGRCSCGSKLGENRVAGGQRADSEEELVIDLALSGPVEWFLDRVTQRVVARAGTKGDVLMYHKLAVRDAAGKSLPAWFDLASQQVLDQSKIENLADLRGYARRALPDHH